MIADIVFLRKKFTWVVFFLFMISLTGILKADLTENRFQAGMDDLSKQCIEKYPLGTMKYGLSILPFDEEYSGPKGLGGLHGKLFPGLRSGARFFTWLIVTRLIKA